MHLYWHHVQIILYMRIPWVKNWQRKQNINIFQLMMHPFWPLVQIELRVFTYKELRTEKQGAFPKLSKYQKISWHTQLTFSLQIKLQKRLFLACNLSLKRSFFQIFVTFSSATDATIQTPLFDWNLHTYATSWKVKKNASILSHQNINKAIGIQLTFLLQSYKRG